MSTPANLEHGPERRLRKEGAQSERTQTLSVLVFDLADKQFGLLTLPVLEIVRAVSIAALPRAPAIVEGVINYRGEIVPVLDMRSRFALPARALHPDQHFIIARANGRLVALRVDRVHELVSVNREAVESAAVAPGAEYVAGVARLTDGLLVIHDLEAFLSLDEARVLDSAMARAVDVGETGRRRKRS